MKHCFLFATFIFMKRVLFFSLLIATLFLLNACSSETTSQNNVVDKISPNKNVQNVNANTIENGSVAPTPITNVQDANVASNTPLNRLNGKVLQQSNSNEKPKITFIPAPNNSELATIMGSKGEFIQVRNFKSDAQIKSIEQIVTTDKLKIVLKNGKVLEVTVDKDFTSERFVSISPQEILILAGLAKKPDASQTGAT